MGFTLAAAINRANSRCPRLLTLSGWPSVPCFRPPSSHSLVNTSRDRDIPADAVASRIGLALLVGLQQIDRLRRQVIVRARFPLVGMKTGSRPRQQLLAHQDAPPGEIDVRPEQARQSDFRHPESSASA